MALITLILFLNTLKSICINLQLKSFIENALMFIKRIEIENFKNFLSHQTLSVGQKNLIIGKNGSGKSNLLNALSTIFLFTEEKSLQNNNNDEQTTILVEIDNKEKRFMLPLSFTIKMIYKDSLEFFINEKPVSKEEYKGMLENAGFTQECFIMQGKVNDIAMLSPKQRFSLICKIAGVEKYEESKEIALKYLNDESNDRIESLIDKIEMKMRISDDYKRKAEEYENLMKRKAEAEFELMNYELRDLNDEIDKIVVEEQGKTVEYDEGMMEYETKICRDEISRLKSLISDCEDYLNKFDKEIVEQVKSKLNEDNFNPYNSKVSMLTATKNEIKNKIEIAQKDESELYVELKALKYFDAMGTQKEDLGVLEGQLQAKKQEIENYKINKYDKSKFSNLVNERKKLWNSEKQVKDGIKTLKQHETDLENKILYLGKLSVNVFESLKCQEGVLGTVYGIFDVPEMFLDAYEAVCRNSLFWTVVENDDIATKLIETISERATFVALNRVKVRSEGKVLKETKLKKLSDHINCDEKFYNLLCMICKDYYIAEDPQNALELSEKHNINVVTLDGDLFNKNGSITGGYEGSNQVLRELKECKRRIKEADFNIFQITKSLNEISEKIKFEELISEDDSRVLENLKGIARYLEMKIEFIKKKKILLPEISEIEGKFNVVINALPRIKLEFESIDSQLSRAIEKKLKIDELADKLRKIALSISEIERMKLKEQNLIDSLYIRKANGNIENSFNLQKRHILIDKRTQLLAKIGISDFRAIYIKSSRDSLTAAVKEINKNLKNYYGFTKNDVTDDQRVELKQRLLELKDSRDKIISFIDLLDQKKEQTFNVSFSMISENFSYFFKKFTGRNTSLALRADTIDITDDQKVCDIQSLSGGQKTVIALCLIFAIQKNDPSPFYVFDEIDANLDMEHCTRLSEIVSQSNSQYFISTFKSEMINSAEKYFGVAVKDNQSYVAEISKELAFQTIQPVSHA